MAEERWRALLLDLKQDLELLDNAAENSRSAVELDQSRVGRLSRMDALQGQAMNNAIAARRRQKISAIDAAMARLKDGEFGYCMKCGDQIALKRLELDPTASICLDCSK